MLKLLIVTNTLRSFYTHRLPLAIAAAKQGYEVHVATDLNVTLQLQHQDIIQYHAINFHKNSINPCVNLLPVFQLIKLYRAILPDIIHHVTMKPVLFGSIAACFFSAACYVNAISGLGYLFMHDSFKVRILRKVLFFGFYAGFSSRRCSFIFQNKDDMALFRQYRLTSNKHHVTLIPGMGVDLARYQYKIPKNQVLQIVLPARLLWDKGVGEFIAVARKLGKKKQARFILVGAIDPMNPASITQKDLQAWVVEGVVEHWGWSESMNQVFSNADIVCLPSYREGMPKALLEAAASGCAIVTTNAVGCKDVIVDSVSGFLVPVKDVSILESCLQKLIDSKELRLSFAKKARQRAEQLFALDNIVSQHFEFYDIISSAN